MHWTKEPSRSIHLDSDLYIFHVTGTIKFKVGPNHGIDSTPFLWLWECKNLKLSGKAKTLEEIEVLAVEGMVAQLKALQSELETRSKEVIRCW